MHSGFRYLSSLLLAAAFLAPAVTTGCAARTYHDPYYNDSHRWDRNEKDRYQRWIVENHRDNRDFRKLNRDEQKQYWDWRHNRHDDHDHDRDHDRH
ncbi:MAG: hypothetical protein LAO18_23245 [Acidobacteriia bacterium]|nr:hypothetical protein [Terriglobia bacterium]